MILSWFRRRKPQLTMEGHDEAMAARADSDAWRDAHGGCTYPECPCGVPCSSTVAVAPVRIVNGRVTRGR